jgi:hypothetical protein
MTKKERNEGHWKKQMRIQAEATTVGWLVRKLR